MAYNPNLYNPYMYQQQPSPIIQQNQVNGIVYVDGVDGAKAYQIPPNSVSPPLMLKEDNVFVVKSKDGSGGEVMSAYRFEEIPMSDLMKPEGEYVTKADFDEFAAKIMEAINGEHSAPTQQQPAVD